MGMYTIFSPQLSQSAIFLNEANTIFFVPLNEIPYSTIYNSKYAKMFMINLELNFPPGTCRWDFWKEILQPNSEIFSGNLNKN